MVTGMLTGIAALVWVWYMGATAWPWYAFIGAAVTSGAALTASAVLPAPRDA
jgi:hypothetical protein